MPTKILTAGLVVLMGAMFGACAFADSVGVQGERQPGRPGIVCLNPGLDFGAVYSDAVVKHAYILTNQGASAVKLVAVRTTCGCTTAVAATNELAPGQATTVDVVINFKGRRGRQTKAIYAETDDPSNKIVRLEFTGVVMVPIEAQPEGIHFGTVGMEERLEREVLLTAESNQTFHVLAAKSASPQMAVTVEPREAGKQYLVKVVYDGPRKPGTFMTSVEVETDHPQMRTISIPVAAFVAGDLVAAPASLLLIPSATNVPKTVWVNLWSPPGKAFHVTKVNLPGEGMASSVTVLTPGRCRLEIKTWGPLNGLEGQAIRVETDMVTMKEVVIPIRVLTAH